MIDASNDILSKANQLKKKRPEKRIVDDKYPLSLKVFFTGDEKKLKNDIKKKGPPHPYYYLTYRDAILEAPQGVKIHHNNKNGGKLFDYRGFPFWHPKFDHKQLVKSMIDGLNAEKKQQELDMSDSSTTDPNLVIKPDDVQDYTSGKLHFIEMPPHESLILHPWGDLSVMEKKTQYFTPDIIRSNTIKATIEISKDSETFSKKKMDYFNSSNLTIKWGPIPSSITIYTRTNPKEQISVKYTSKDFVKNKKSNNLRNGSSTQEEDTEGDE